ncbi:MAG: hypothetical protein ACREP6_08565, partial [Candidatus Binataceae bacterium]
MNTLRLSLRSDGMTTITLSGLTVFAIDYLWPMKYEISEIGRRLYAITNGAHWGGEIMIHAGFN